jgi:hypothetical protein
MLHCLKGLLALFISAKGYQIPFFRRQKDITLLRVIVKKNPPKLKFIACGIRHSSFLHSEKGSL